MGESAQAARVGPRVTMSLDCFGCAHTESERYRVQGDSGSDVYCTHDQHGEPGKARRYVGDTRWTTPDWCPLRGPALAAFLAEQAPPRAASDEE
jgi:hypothetical protein